MVAIAFYILNHTGSVVTVELDVPQNSEFTIREPFINFLTYCMNVTRSNGLEHGASEVLAGVGHRAVWLGGCGC